MLVSDTKLRNELTPTLERLVDRHFSTMKEWFPHELVPWGRAREFEPGEVWDPQEFPLPDGVRSAILVNLLTEDNLPYYFRTIERMFGDDGPWGAWSKRWTAEEARHSIVLRDYATVTRAIDPVHLERARMHQMSSGVVPEPDSALDGLAYVALQELATRISHRNTGKLLEDKAGYDVMARVGADENLHYLFYRDLISAAIEVDPSASVVAIERQVREFEMPGTGIIDFGDHSLAIAKTGIYDLAIHHEMILVPVVLRHWNVGALEGLTPEAERARDALVVRIDKIGRAGRRMASRWSQQGSRGRQDGTECQNDESAA